MEAKNKLKQVLETTQNPDKEIFASSVTQRCKYTS